MASCCICGNNSGKISMTGLNGKICQDCQRNIVNIRTGKVDAARSYFNNIDFESSSSKQFVLSQYSQYASAVDDYNEEQGKILRRQEQEKVLNSAINNMILSTTPTLDGYKIVKYIDVLYSEALYKVSFGKALSSALSNTVDSFKIFSDTELSGTTKIIQEAKDYVKQDLMKKAAILGANAIVGIDIESSYSSDGIAKASINGTAVTIEKEEI